MFGLDRRAGQDRRDGARRRGRAWIGLILLMAIVGQSIVYAGDAENVLLVVGRSTVLNTGLAIARVSLTSPDIADAMVTSSSEVLINGKAPGTISMFVWDRSGAIRRYEVVVQRDMARLGDQLRELFPGETINTHSTGKSVVLSGVATSKAVMERAVSLASGYVDKKEDVINLLQVQDRGTDQVLLRVRFAEVSRSALTELGVNFFTSPAGYKNVQGRVTTQQFPAPVFDSDGDKPKLVFSDFLNFFLWDFKHDLGTVIKALQVRGLFQSLAEPNLVAESGKEASFLAGGEIPVPIAQPSAGGVSVTVMYKEFGIRLNFTPNVNGDRVHLKVRPEVSSLDFANAVTLQGFRIPALSTRRIETELELQHGQTFAIAGLINNTMNKSLQKVPGIGDIPILGLLFKSQAAQKDRTELVVMITPEILPRGHHGVSPNLPKLAEPYLTPLDPRKSQEPPAPAFRTSGAAQATSPAPTAPKSAPLDPAAAAAAVSALTPTTKPIIKEETQQARPADANATTPNRKMTKDEQAAFDAAKREHEAERAKAAQAERESAERDKKAAKQAALQAEIDRKKAEEEQRHQAEAQKRQAAIEKAAQEAAAKRAAEQAKRQAEIDKKHGKAVADAEAKLKAAQAAYEAESAKAKKQ